MIQNNNNMTEIDESNIFPTFIDVRYKWQEAKKAGYSNSNLYVKDVKNKGLGVFSTNDIKKGEVVEYCHSIPIETPRQWMRDAGITKYCYWSNDMGMMPLGFGPIYNSADKEFLKNTQYFLFPEDMLIVFVAQKNISANEEILVWWGEDYYNNWCEKNHQ
jgi:hypothetical protein